MDTIAIKQGLKAKGCSFTIIAKVLGRTPSQVSAVASRRSTSREIAEAICKVLNMEISSVFPDVPSYKEPHIPNKKENIEYWRKQLTCSQSCIAQIGAKYLPYNFDLPTLAVVSIALPDGHRVFSPMAKKHNSNLYEPIVPSQLVIWKSQPEDSSNG